MSQKLNENFDSKIAVDPFYSASNMARLRRGMMRLTQVMALSMKLLKMKAKQKMMIDWEDGQPSSFSFVTVHSFHQSKNSSKKRVTYTRFFVIIDKNMYLWLQVRFIGWRICYNIHRVKKCT